MSGAVSRRHDLSLVPAAIRTVLVRLLAPLRIAVRRSRLYRLGLKGPLPDRIAYHPSDSLPRRLDEADALLRGRFRFAGQTLEIREGSVFDKPPPSEAWAEALHGFQWLPPLAAAGGDAARTLATNLFTQWLRRYARYGEPSWLPQVMARRLANTFVHGRLVFTNSDVLWRSRVFVSLRDQARMLARVAREAPPGLPTLEVASVLVLSAICLDQNRRRLSLGLGLLEEELGKQILPDGGHVSRSPFELMHAYRLLSMVLESLDMTNSETPGALRAVHDRMAPMLRFFQHADEGLALFNGSNEGDARVIASLLSRSESAERPSAQARHSGYQRLSAGPSVVLVDTGMPPPIAYAAQAHAGCLSFEFSTSEHRVIVNCGAADSCLPAWDDALCATAAHSTLTLADTSSGAILPPGWLRNLVGRRLVEGPAHVASTRDDAPDGLHLHASHDGYEAQFGYRHERYVALDPEGSGVVGEDRLVPTVRRQRSRSVPFAIRFHVHPDVRVASAQGGDLLLKLPNGEGWRFRISGGELGVEESVYLGDGSLRRSEQLVISGVVRDTPTEIGWAFEQINAPATSRPNAMAAETP
jgi:uncharacterized heparinase superfamily protein